MGEILFMKHLKSRSPTSLCVAFDGPAHILAATGDWSLERIGKGTSRLEYCMKNRGLKEHFYIYFDMPLLPAFVFHSDSVTMAARLVPSKQVIG